MRLPAVLVAVLAAILLAALSYYVLGKPLMELRAYFREPDTLQLNHRRGVSPGVNESN